MKPTESENQNDKGELPQEEALLRDLREADRFYQGFQRQVNLGKLIEQVGRKLSGTDQSRTPQPQP